MGVSPWLGATLLLIGSLGPGRGAAEGLPGPLPPSPYDILQSTDLETPVIDALAFCRPRGLDASADSVLDHARRDEWQPAREKLAERVAEMLRPGPELFILDAVLEARTAEERSEWLEAEAMLRDRLLRDELAAHDFCLRMELARILLFLERESEAAAQLRRAERATETEDPGPAARTQSRSLGPRFSIARANASMPISDSVRWRSRAMLDSPPRRGLRLTDLSFDAGKVDQVSVEYEALLPRAAAFGGSTVGWALRAAEAAIDGGHLERGLRWIERFLESGPRRDARDAAEIRLADLDVRFDDPMGARKRLSAVVARRRDDRLGSLAAVRAIDLGVAAGSSDDRIGLLLRVLREQRRGVRRYALGVLLRELQQRDDYDGALAVATRLAYEGVDPIVTPGFEAMLDGLLREVTSTETALACGDLVRALGGRYGILIERASHPEPFVELGLCFEEIELPWLAVKVYRTVTRRFGIRGAESVTLPLARSSLAIGESELARRVATAALEDPGPDEAAWRGVHGKRARTTRPSTPGARRRASG